MSDDEVTVGPVGGATLVSLGDDLAEWTDWDNAAYLLGRALGLFAEVDLAEVKHIFWTDNDLGQGLRATLLTLAEAHVLDRREQPDEQFRWAR